jgi:Zn-dependent protease with chaperone function
VSSGALERLSPAELRAVLAHERAHLHAHHDLVLFPFYSLARSLPESRSLAAASSRVATLVEMAADEVALRECDPDVLAAAICALSDSAASPSEGNVPATSRMQRRLERAFGEKRRSKLFAFGSLLAAAGILALPLAVLFAPLSGS